mmetsp:Transcript_28260/g.64004  ORF Transcript_28260/g.64004 Transcript_28260/m.64004 type:complete len:284 (+) Transcript_28260:77-928(+)
MAAGLLLGCLALAGLSVIGAIHTMKPPFPTVVPDPTQDHRCIKPEEKEKIVYLVVHGETTDDERDPMLTEEAKKWAGSLKQDPTFQLALSEDVKRRADLVIMAPLRRTMETALLAFGKELAEARWELSPDIQGTEYGQVDEEAGTLMLADLHARPEFVEKYEDLNAAYEPEDGKIDHMLRFTLQLINRPEKNIIVVATRYEALLMNTAIKEGQTKLLALTGAPGGIGKRAFGAYHPLSAPEFWEDCIQAADPANSWMDDYWKTHGLDREAMPSWMKWGGPDQD